ncbi:unnamed protein product [Symbiodinium sp. CCMP2592]|nr:unnamed protein product [Symbiodinium sp. CCMP2592]
MLLDGVLDFDLGELGESDDEGLPTGKDDANDWSNMTVLNKKPQIAQLGKVYMEAILSLKSALGTFARVHCNPERLPPGDESTSSGDRAARHGDIIPIHPGLILPSPRGVTKENVHWVRAIVTVLNYLYCAAWASPVCVPMPRVLGNAQLRVIGKIAAQVDRLLARGGTVGPAPEAVKKLKAKKFDYNGQPIDHMLDLEADKVIKAWPSPGSAAVVSLEECLPPDLRQAIQNPADYLLPETELPERHRGSRVRASDQEWFKIVKAGYDRGMFTAVKDEDVPVDRRGFLITNGPGGVAKNKVQDGVTVEMQRFISILCPTNEAMRLLPGAQDSLPYVGQLTAILAEKDSYLTLDSEDLHSAFNLFRMPPAWAPYFSFAKKVRGDALGLSARIEVRPGLTVVPMGWTSAVTLIQAAAAIRHISYEIARVPSFGDVSKDRPLPSEGPLTVLYLDNFDELRYLKKEIAEAEAGQPSENHLKFITACEMLGLPRNLGKQLSGALQGTLQGGEILGKENVLRHAYDKTVELMELGLGLMSMELVDEFCLRHWCGKAAFAVYATMDWAKQGTQVILPGPVLDEVLCMSLLLPLAETDLSSPISPEISCTDASPTGGGCSVAKAFKEKSLLLPLPLEDPGTCAGCGALLDQPAWRTYRCPRKCGLRCCTLRCTRKHNEECCRRWWHVPKFGDRFAGKNFPMSKAAGLKGIEVQLPLDYQIEGDRWDFKTEPGKERLDDLEADGDLMWTHWSPDRHTFSKQRGQGFWNDRWEWERGLPALRNRDHPEGFNNLRRPDLVMVRQANAMAKRAVKGLLEAHRRGRFASLEHPWASYIWNLPEMEPLYGGDWLWSTFSLCCHGGEREEWLTVVHNSPSLHAVLHKPTCDGHSGTILGYDYIDIENQDEYPWAFCLVFMEGVHDELSARYSEPFGCRAMTLESLMHHQLKGATRGLQDGAAVDWAVTQTVQFLDTMDAGNEAQHLAWLLRHTYHTQGAMCE